jgi:tryptophan-rich sensory protein
VWSALYLAIAIAGWRLWRSTGRFVAPLQIWMAQLFLNALWSFLFFGIHRMDLALIDIGLLLASIIAFIVTARRYSVAASWLFVPYALWVGFATALNFTIWQMNDAGFGG